MDSQARDSSIQSGAVTLTVVAQETAGRGIGCHVEMLRERQLDLCSIAEMETCRTDALAYIVQRLGPDRAARAAASAARQPALRFRKLAHEPNPPNAPYAGSSDSRSIASTVGAVLGIIELIGGRAFAYADENHGRLVRDVVARADAEAELSSQGWARTLPWHMDGACRPLRDRLAGTELSPAPRWLVFGVIYDTPRLPITFATLDDLVAVLDEQALDSLRRPEFDVLSPESVQGAYVTAGVPLLWRDPQIGFVSRYNAAKCKGRTPRARRALASVSQALENRALVQTLDISAGDVIVLDNWRTLHTREAYTPRWDGRDRWLIRVYAASRDARGMPVSASEPWVCR